MDGCNSLCRNERKKLLRLQCFIILSSEREKARRRLSGSYLPTPSLSAFRAQLFSSTVLSAEHSSLTRRWKFDYTHGGILRIPNPIQLPEEGFRDALNANFVAFGVQIAHQEAPLIGCFYHQGQKYFTKELIPNIINLNIPGKGERCKYFVSFLRTNMLAEWKIWIAALECVVENCLQERSSFIHTQNPSGKSTHCCLLYSPRMDRCGCC
jgi:hypothetical protein